MIKWMIHLRKQISVAALSLTPERKINSVERAETQTQHQGSRVSQITAKRLLLLLQHTCTNTHITTHKLQLQVMP